MAAGTVHGDFGAPPKLNLSLLPHFPHLLAISDGAGCHNPSFLS